jgi:hypothetical protein
MNCPVIRIATEVVERIRELADAELGPIIAGLEWLRRNPLPMADEQCMGIPPSVGKIGQSLIRNQQVAGSTPAGGSSIFGHCAEGLMFPIRHQLGVCRGVRAATIGSF